MYEYNIFYENENVLYNRGLSKDDVKTINILMQHYDLDTLIFKPFDYSNIRVIED